MEFALHKCKKGNLTEESEQFIDKYVDTRQGIQVEHGRVKQEFTKERITRMKLILNLHGIHFRNQLVCRMGLWITPLPKPTRT